jgi:zinc transport system permease protein
MFINLFSNIFSNSLFLALLSSFFLGLIVPIIGSFLLVQRKSGLVDSLAHVSMLGSALGIWAGINLYVFAILVVVMFSFLVFELGSKIQYKEAILALFTGFSLAFLSIIRKVSGIRVNLEGIFFGNINSIGIVDLGWIISISVLVLVLMGIFYRQFLWISIDEELALTQGINVPKIRILFNIIGSLVFAVFIQIFGIVIVSMISIAPILIVSNIIRGFSPKVFFSVLISIISLWTSILISYFWLDYSISSILAIILFISLILGFILKKS